MTGNGMSFAFRVGRVVVLGCVILSLSCACGVRRAAGSDDLDVFLAGFREAVIAGDTGLILEAYVDPGYRAEQLEGLLEGDEGQFFDELFGLGRRGFKDIVDLEYVCEGIVFEDLARHGSLDHRQTALDAATRAPIEVGKCGVVVTYADGGRVEDWVFVVRYGDGERRFGIDGPRG